MSQHDKDTQLESSPMITKRNEHISDLKLGCRGPVFNILLQLWKEVYTNKEIPQRYWLEKFQLNLKKTTTIETDTIMTYLQKSTRKHLLHDLFEAYMLTGELYHTEKPMIHEDHDILISFVKDVLVKTAREIWYSPFIFYYITHKKDKVEEGKLTFDKIYFNAVRFTLKQQTNEMILTQRSFIQKQAIKLDIPTTIVQPSSPVQDTTLTKEEKPLKELVSDSDSESNSKDLDSDTEVSSISSLESARDSHSNTKHIEINKSVKEFASKSPSLYEERYTLGDDLALKPDSLSRSSSYKAILSDDDSSNDLYIPRKTDISNTHKEINTTGKTKIKKTSELAKLLPHVTATSRQMTSSYYKGNPALKQHLKSKLTR